MSSFRAPSCLCVGRVRTPSEFSSELRSRIQSGLVRYSAVIPPLRLLRKKSRLTKSGIWVVQDTRDRALVFSNLVEALIQHR